MLNLKLFFYLEPYRYLEQNGTQIDNVMSAKYVLVSTQFVFSTVIKITGFKISTGPTGWNKVALQTRNMAVNNKPMYARVWGPTATVNKSPKYPLIYKRHQKMVM
jgi:hypothetical protein